MAVEIVMPNLGFDVQQARLIEWLKQPGDTIQKGEVIAVVESDKANVELESIAGGIVLEQLVAPGVEVEVGTVIARISQAQERPTSKAAAPIAEHPSVATTVEISPVARKLAADHGLDLATVEGSGPRGRITREDVEAALGQRSVSAAAATASAVHALPKVRKAAREAGIDLAAVPATGRNGIITAADLQAYQQASAAVPTHVAAEPPAAPPAVTLPEGAKALPLSRVRQVIAKRMSESKRSAPHFYVTGEFDLEQALPQLNTFPEPRPGLNDLIQYLTVQALRRAPALNATYQDETIYQYDAVNLAIAVARTDGLVTPVLHGADRFSLTGLAQEGRKLLARTRENRLQPEDLQGGTFTISNLGVVRQVDQFVAILNPPQVAILAVGTVKPRPIVIDGGLHVRHTVHLTLSGDHRAVDGMDLAQFMAAFQSELDNFSGKK